MRLAALLLLQLGLLAGVATAQAGEGAWRSGRATFYGATGIRKQAGNRRSLVPLQVAAAGSVPTRAPTDAHRNCACGRTRPAPLPRRH